MKFKRVAVGVVAVLAIAVPVAGGSTPTSDLEVEASCAPNPVPGGSTIDCSWKVTNTSASTRFCSVRGTFWEAGSFQGGGRDTNANLAPGETITGTDSRTTLDTGRKHGGSYRVRADCRDDIGRRTNVRVPFTVTR